MSCIAAWHSFPTKWEGKSTSETSSDHVLQPKPHMNFFFSNDLLCGDDEDYRRNFTLQIKIIIAIKQTHTHTNRRLWGVSGSVFES